ncbi:MAG TPA: DUF2325 domain-containing protein [Novimethylophilus sp.]|jgi:hypothetical protein|uniref:DUF2325 domain-containing protein n=1 Tax=Novimethylophilus sp. TaxID=2137426 RepID=UPI002F41EFA7
MTTALIVGGDYVTGIKQTLAAFGIDHIAHWGGRKAGDGKHAIPRDTQLVVMVTDWINHSMAGKVKRNAEKLGVQVVYTRGNGGNLYQPLSRLAERGQLSESSREEERQPQMLLAA